MPTSLESLPPELLHQIFRLVIGWHCDKNKNSHAKAPRRTVETLSLVSKRWNQLAQPFLFTQVHCSKDRLHTFFRKMDLNPHVMAFVKSLHLNNVDGSDQWPLVDLPQLVQLSIFFTVRAGEQPTFIFKNLPSLMNLSLVRYLDSSTASAFGDSDDQREAAVNIWAHDLAALPSLKRLDLDGGTTRTDLEWISRSQRREEGGADDSTALAKLQICDFWLFSVDLLDKGLPFEILPGLINFGTWNTIFPLIGPHSLAGLCFKSASTLRSLSVRGSAVPPGDDGSMGALLSSFSTYPSSSNFTSLISLCLGEFMIDIRALTPLAPRLPILTHLQLFPLRRGANTSLDPPPELHSTRFIFHHQLFFDLFRSGAFPQLETVRMPGGVKEWLDPEFGRICEERGIEVLRPPERTCWKTVWLDFKELMWWNE
ncbi:hypothetical protein T439DRAFT_326049 [Meredithblackwellia eburnea MCA 4105]